MSLNAEPKKTNAIIYLFIALFLAVPLMPAVAGQTESELVRTKVKPGPLPTQLSERLYRTESYQAEYTEQVPYEAQEEYQDTEIYTENEYRCHDETHYEQRCGPEQKCETEYKRYCRQEQQCENIPHQKCPPGHESPHRHQIPRGTTYTHRHPRP